MTDSYLMPAEVDALQSSGLDRATPFMIQGVSLGFFSIARYYGGAKFNGASYKYLPDTDELIRDDVMKWVAGRRKSMKERKPRQRESRPHS